MKTVELLQAIVDGQKHIPQGKGVRKPGIQAGKIAAVRQRSRAEGGDGGQIPVFLSGIGRAQGIDEGQYRQQRHGDGKAADAGSQTPRLFPGCLIVIKGERLISRAVEEDIGLELDMVDPALQPGKRDGLFVLFHILTAFRNDNRGRDCTDRPPVRR